MRTTIRVKTEEEFIREYGPRWQHKKFRIKDVPGECYVQVHPKSLGAEITLDEDEYSYFKDEGVLRWSNDDVFFGMAYITHEMLASNGELKTSGISSSIYDPQHELIRVNTQSSYTIRESVITDRMNLVELNVKKD